MKKYIILNLLIAYSTVGASNLNRLNRRPAAPWMAEGLVSKVVVTPNSFNVFSPPGVYSPLIYLRLPKFAKITSPSEEMPMLPERMPSVRPVVTSKWLFVRSNNPYGSPRYKCVRRFELKEGNDPR